jgi:hypothetical protein
MAGQMHTLTAKLAEVQRQLELQHQIDRDRTQAAAAAASAAAVAQRQLFVRMASSAAAMAATVARAVPDCEAMRAIQQVRVAVAAFLHAKPHLRL